MKIDSESRIVDSVIDQLQYCKKISKIVVATTDLDDDAKLFEHVKNQNIECFRGSSENVLDRYFQCATKYGFDVIVRITADNPFIDPVIVDDLIGLFQSSNYDYGSNTNPRSFPPVSFLTASFCVIIPFGVVNINIPMLFAGRNFFSHLMNSSFLTENLGLITLQLFMLPTRLTSK